MKPFSEITRDALELPLPQRRTLAGILLEMDEVDANPQVAAAWDEEIRARIAAIDLGEVTGIPYGDVMRRANEQLPPC